VANDGYFQGLAKKIFPRGANSGEISLPAPKLREKHFLTEKLIAK